MSQQCKKCDSTIPPKEVKVSGHYSHFKCPICAVDISSNKSKGCIALIYIGFFAWMLVLAYQYLAG